MQQSNAWWAWDLQGCFCGEPGINLPIKVGPRERRKSFLVLATLPFWTALWCSKPSLEKIVSTAMGGLHDKLSKYLYMLELWDYEISRALAKRSSSQPEGGLEKRGALTQERRSSILQWWNTGFSCHSLRCWMVESRVQLSAAGQSRFVALTPYQL